MTVTTPVDTDGAPREVPSGGPARWWRAVPVALAAVAAAALLLPWGRAGAGPVLLEAGLLRALPPDAWSGIEVTGARALVVAALAAVAVVVGASTWDSTGARACVAAGGGAAAACGVAALVGWGPTAAPGVWVAVTAGVVAVGAALVRRAGATRTWPVLVAALVAAAGTVALPGGEQVPDRAAAGPFQRVATLGAWWSPRSGSAGLSSSGGDPRPVVVDGAPGIVGAAGVLIADPRGRARVLARTEPGAPAPLGVAGGRVARWVTVDALTVTELRADGPLEVTVRDVGAASPVGDDGSVWLRSDVDPSDTVRRLTLGDYDGRQELSAVYLPVVTIQRPDGEGPIDVQAVRPVPGGALRVAYPDPGKQIQLLTDTAAGIAVRPLTRVSAPPCLFPAVVGTGDVRAMAADATGVWYPTPDQRLAHRDPDGTVRTVPTRLPGAIAALAAPGDGSVLFIARDDDGNALWRLPDANAALTDPPGC